MKTMINEVRNSLTDFLNLFKLKYEKKKQDERKIFQSQERQKLSMPILFMTVS